MEKILFFDIDGTLGVHGVIIEEYIAVLKQLMEKGYKTFICTGRAPYYAQNLFGDLVSGIVSCNGRYISYLGEKLYGRAFLEDELDGFKKQADMQDLGVLLVSHDCSIPYHFDESQIKTVEKEYGKDRIVLEDNHPVYTIDLFYKDHEGYLRLVDCFSSTFVINDHGGHGSCDCSTKEFDKGHAIAYLLDYFHINKEDSYAFGDGYNDQAMFREVKHGVAMGNAVDELKEKAEYISDDFDQGGITKALDHYGLL